MKQKRWLREFFLEVKIAFTQDSMNFKTYIGFLIMLYLFFIYLFIYLFILHINELHLSKDTLFLIQVGLICLFNLFLLEWFAIYTSIDNEGEITLHYQVIENYIFKKMRAKYIISTFHSFVNLFLLMILVGIIEGLASLFSFVLVLLPLFILGGIASVFSSTVFPKFDWLEQGDIPTYKSSFVMGAIYFVWLSMTNGIATQIIYPKMFYFLIFLYWLLTAGVIILLIKVTPIVLKKKLLLSLKFNEEARDNVYD